MKNSKLIRVLSTFTPKDWREMEQFLLSPFFNKRADVVLLFKYLGDRLREQKEVESKASIQAALFPEMEFDVIRFDLLMSYLFRLLRQFLQQKEIQQEEWYLDLKLAQSLRKRGLAHEFNQSIQQLQKKLGNQRLRDAHFYRTMYTLKWEQSRVLTEADPTTEANMAELNQSIDVEYLSTKLRHACLTATHRSIYKTDQHQVSLLSDLLKQVENTTLLNTPCVAVYYYVYQLLQAPEEEDNFGRFKKILFDSGHQFPASEVRDLYLMAINYCVRQANSGKQKFLNELLELYQQGLKENFLLENGILSRFTYHNIVGVGLSTNNDVWTEQFISQYRPTLEKKYRESSYSFNTARLAYNRKDYDSALVLLQRSNYRDLLLNLAAKALLLKIYFELEESDLLYSHLEAMQKFLSRKRIIGYHKSNYQNIIGYTKKLLSMNPFDKEDRNHLAQQINAEKVLTEKKWFLEQLTKV